MTHSLPPTQHLPYYILLHGTITKTGIPLNHTGHTAGAKENAALTQILCTK